MVAFAVGRVFFIKGRGNKKAQWMAALKYVYFQLVAIVFLCHWRRSETATATGTATIMGESNRRVVHGFT